MGGRFGVGLEANCHGSCRRVCGRRGATPTVVVSVADRPRRVPPGGPIAPGRTADRTGLAPAATTQSAPSSPGSRMPVDAARLGHEQEAGGPIPVADPGLVEAVEPAARDPREVDRGRPGATDVANPGDDVRERRRLERAPLRRVAEPCADSARVRSASVGRAHRRAVQERARAADGRERLGQRRVVDDRDEPALRVAACDRDRPGRDPVAGSWSCRRAGRSPRRRPVVPGRCPLSSAMRPSSGRAAETASRSSALGVAVGVRDHVGGAALGVDPALRPAEPAEQELARRVRRAHGELEEGFGRHRASLDRRRGPPHFHLQTLDFWQHLVHPPCIGLEVDVIPPQSHKLTRAQPMPIGQQDGGGVPMTPAVAAAASMSFSISRSVRYSRGRARILPPPGTLFLWACDVCQGLHADQQPPRRPRSCSCSPPLHPLRDGT